MSTSNVPPDAAPLGRAPASEGSAAPGARRQRLGGRVSPSPPIPGAADPTVLPPPGPGAHWHVPGTAPGTGGSPRRRVGTAPSPLRVDRTGGPRCRGGARSHSADPQLRNPGLCGFPAPFGRMSRRPWLQCLHPFPLPCQSGHHEYRVPTRTTRRASAGRAGYRTHGCPHLWRPHPRHWREGTFGCPAQVAGPTRMGGSLLMPTFTPYRSGTTSAGCASPAGWQLISRRPERAFLERPRHLGRLGHRAASQR